MNHFSRLHSWMPCLVLRSALWRGLCAALLCVLGMAPAVAAVADYIVAQSRFEDSTARMAWAEVQQQVTTPFSGALARGYGKAPVWVKLRIDPSRGGASPDDMLYLRIRPGYLDELVLYDPLQQPSRVGPIGDRYPLSAQAAHSTRFTFRLPAGTAPRDVWVRLETTSTRMARFEVLDEQGLAISNGVLDMAGSFYLGLLGLFALWGVIQLALRPEPLMLCFVAHQATALVFGSNMLGYTKLLLEERLGPHLLDVLTSATGIVASSVAVAFAYFLMKEISEARWRNRIIAGVLSVFVLLLVLLAFGRVMEALQGNMSLILVVPTVLLIMALVSRPSVDASENGKLPKQWVVGYFVLTLVFTLAAAVPSLGLIEAPELSLYVVLLYSLSSGVLMITMLLYRAHLQLKYQQAQAAKAWANAQQAEQERSHRLDREKLLAMLGHELKTPLATLRMLLSNQTIPSPLSQRMDASVQEMAGVIDRIVQTGRLDHQAIAVNEQRCSLHALLVRALRELPDQRRVVVEPQTEHQDEIETDPELLTVVLRNLLDNALKYSPNDAQVSVRYALFGTPRCWQVEVSNPPGRAGWPDAEHLFDKYYRSPKAAYRAGSGLGLYIVQALAQMMDTRIVYAPDAGFVRFIVRAGMDEAQKNSV